jgi:hypothetical protein
MPTRKQRRRRQKELRHEWEEVYLDAEGRELAPEEVEEILPELAPKQQPRKASAGSSRPAARTTRGTRAIQPPSWRRVLKRGAIFAPLMYVFIAITNRNGSLLTHVAITVQLLVIFLPFSYLMDTLTYRLWKKRQAKTS